MRRPLGGEKKVKIRIKEREGEDKHVQVRSVPGTS
jgi:hypothetical protein